MTRKAPRLIGVTKRRHMPMLNSYDSVDLMTPANPGVYRRGVSAKVRQIGSIRFAVLGGILYWTRADSPSPEGHSVHDFLMD